MAALHIVPVAGAKPTPKVLALIRERSLAMEAGRIATHGFKADGHDVLMQQAGGSIRALVRGGSSMPYMLTVRLEFAQYQYSNRISQPTSIGPSTYEAATRSISAKLRIVSPISTNWITIPVGSTSTSPDKIATSGGLIAYSSGTDGYFYICTQCPLIETDTYGGNQLDPSWSGEFDNFAEVFYTAIGNQPKCHLYGDYYHNYSTGTLPVYPWSWWKREERTLIHGDGCALATIRFGDLSMMSGLPAADQKIIVEFAVQYSDTTSGASVPTSLDVDVTAEMFAPPKIDPKSFYLHTGNPFSVDADHAPTLQSGKTLTLKRQMQPYSSTILPSARFSFDYATNQMSLTNV